MTPKLVNLAVRLPNTDGILTTRNPKFHHITRVHLRAHLHTITRVLLHHQTRVAQNTIMVPRLTLAMTIPSDPASPLVGAAADLTTTVDHTAAAGADVAEAEAGAEAVAGVAVVSAVVSANRTAATST